MTGAAVAATTEKWVATGWGGAERAAAAATQRLRSNRDSSNSDFFIKPSNFLRFTDTTRRVLFSFSMEPMEIRNGDSDPTCRANRASMFALENLAGS